MNELNRNKERLALALEAAGLDLWENDLVTGEVTFKALKTLDQLGYEGSEMAGTVEEILGLVHPDDLPHLQQAVQDHLDGKTPQYRCEFRLRAKNGAWIWFANFGKVMDGTATAEGKRFVGVTFNIDDRKRKEHEIEQMNRLLAEKNALLENLNLQLELLASTDSLTGLTNRRKLMELGLQECKRAERFRHPLSVLMLDIDYFKSINDTWGHLVGDQVIRAVAEVCKERVRQGVDTVARFGGEEFILLLPETNMKGAYQLAEVLRESIAQREVVANAQGDHAQFTVSIGAASCDGSNIPAFEELLNRADTALYKAKQSGRNSVQD
ncbi:sensor domain-containing diguanylate cyclase [Alkalimonas sp. NCh-2]|uniref:sensor domain-containing diguanylate cyclase n=1 Tax=Alkalimonas sp. NCh-2 TaxID=3144846 RepID=UPI0031F66525